MLRFRSILPYSLTFIFGAGAMLGVTALTDNDRLSSTVLCGQTLRDMNSSYSYIKPLVACDVGATVETPELGSLKTKVTTLINSAKAEEQVDVASMYFRDLDSGQWTAVNLDETYRPASLFKVPLLMAYLKIAEQHPEILKQEIEVAADPTPNMAQDIAPEKSLNVGETYTVDELLHYMIAYSDNRAEVLLTNYVDTAVLDDIFGDLQVPIPASMTEQYTLSARSYSRFFRTLYNASYLGDSMSEKALELLSGVTYPDGLRAGVPSDVKIAHKFGEAKVTLQNGKSGHELHDCGIVYEAHPYLICVMTRGEMVSDLEELIANVSQTVYDDRNEAAVSK